MVDIVTFPLAELVALTWLKDEFSAREDTAKVVTDIPNPRPERMVRLVNTGGQQINQVSLDVQLTFECWEVSTYMAAELSRLTRGIVFALDQESVNGAWVRSITSVGEPSFSADPETNSPRYIFTVRLNLSPDA